MARKPSAPRAPEPARTKTPSISEPSTTDTPSNRAELVATLREIAGDLGVGSWQRLRPLAERAHLLVWGVRPDWTSKKRSLPDGRVVTAMGFADWGKDTLNQLIADLDAAARHLREIIASSRTHAVKPETLEALADRLAKSWGMESTLQPKYRRKIVRKRGGSSPRYDADADARLHGDFKASDMSIKAFAQARGMKYGAVKNAIDRHRKRRK